MSTAKQAGYLPGDIAVWATAEKDDGSMVTMGIPLDTLGVEVTLAVGKVVAIDVPTQFGDGTPTTETHVEVLWTNDGSSEPGEIHRVQKDFRNFIGRDDLRLQEELRGAGLNAIEDRSLSSMHGGGVER